jgi:DNA-directed RNA polymerase subunit M/transcription elongation factor TFIIS
MTMRVRKTYNDVKIVIIANDREVECPTCKNNKFNAQLIQENCESSYLELVTTCTECGKMDTYNYRISQKIIDLR